MRKREMTEEQARDILAHIVAQRIRWGVQYDGGEIGLDNLMEALVVLGQADNQAYADLKEELTKANRQLAASNARESKYKKQIEDLKNENDSLTRLCHDLTERMPSVIAGDTDGPAED